MDNVLLRYNEQVSQMTQRAHSSLQDTDEKHWKL